MVNKKLDNLLEIFLGSIMSEDKTCWKDPCRFMGIVFTFRSHSRQARMILPGSRKMSVPSISKSWDWNVIYDIQLLPFLNSLPTPSYSLKIYVQQLLQRIKWFEICASLNYEHKLF